MERRVLTSTGIEVRAKAGEPTKIGGYAAKYYDASDPGTEYELWPDGPVERLMPGCFDSALKRPDDVRCLWNHNAEHILGRTASGTLRLRADNVGLWYEVDLPDTQTAKDLAESIRRGDVNQSSFAFSIISEAWRTKDEREIREIEDIRLYDASPVSFPAYESATVGMRSHGDCKEARAAYDEYKSRPTTTREQALAIMAAVDAECGVHAVQK